MCGILAGSLLSLTQLFHQYELLLLDFMLLLIKFALQLFLHFLHARLHSARSPKNQGGGGGGVDTPPPACSMRRILRGWG